MKFKDKVWTNVEDDFLIKYYNNPDFKLSELALELNRSEGAVRSRCFKLGIKKVVETIPDGYKRCSICNDILPITNFSKNGKKVNGDIKYHSSCKICKKLRDSYLLEKKIKYKKRAKHKTCIVCNENKTSDNFNSKKDSSDLLHPYCKDCLRKKRLENNKLKFGGNI